ncbi:MAG: Crp/Fnr family transcriptional regulator [Candidatus Eremiobacteraeota bacterium]|nr:Crp/Fnr family transcriptional regulator [Candidatus Eremiobacteraeota bacterium]
MKTVQDTAKLLKAIPIFAEVDEEVLKDLCRDSIRRGFKKNSTIWQKGDENAGLYLLLSGMVKVVEYTKDGKEFILNIMVPSDSMGEMSLIDKKPHSADLVSMEECEFLIIPPAAFHSVTRRHPELIQAFIHNVSERLRALSERASVLKYTDVYGRVCKLLSHLLLRYKLPDRCVTLTHEEIGNLIGATRANVTRALNEMQNKGLIRVERNRIFILDAFVCE